MKSAVESAGGLDIYVKGSGITFSVGQRQLLCLARAIIKSSKVNHLCKFSNCFSVWNDSCFNLIASLKQVYYGLLPVNLRLGILPML